MVNNGSAYMCVAINEFKCLCGKNIYLSIPLEQKVLGLGWMGA